MVGYDPPDLEALVRILIEDAAAACRRREDRALNESRRVVMEAEDRIADLQKAARDIGRVRGEAADAAQEQVADGEIETVRMGAFEALWERFQQRLLMRIQALPDTERHAAAIEHWAREAAAAMEAPAEVFTSRRDRPAVYAALLGAGAKDFHVRVDHAVHVGFLVRDLDGRTVIDQRPQALLARHEGMLRERLEASVPAFAETPATSESTGPASSETAKA